MMCDCHRKTDSITIIVQRGTKTNDCINVIVRAADGAVVRTVANQILNTEH